MKDVSVELDKIVNAIKTLNKKGNFGYNMILCELRIRLNKRKGKIHG